MSILIKGAKMPKKCCDCDLLPAEIDWDGQWECPITETIVHKYVEEREGKPPNCPLVEIPPHGRLIDADKLELYPPAYYGLDYFRDGPGNVETMIDDEDIKDAPTVIESEEK